MTVGPGKYDDMATLVRKRTGARMVMVIVLGGDRGTGFSVQTDNPEALMLLPEVLRTVAEDIEKDIKAGIA